MEIETSKQKGISGKDSVHCSLLVSTQTGAIKASREYETRVNVVIVSSYKDTHTFKAQVWHGECPPVITGPIHGVPA